jgi:hypothetical protein
MKNLTGFELTVAQLELCNEINASYSDALYDQLDAVGLTVGWDSDLKEVTITSSVENHAKYLAWKASHDAECAAIGSLDQKRGHTSSLQMGA